jgi:hypothetical protein
MKSHLLTIKMRHTIFPALLLMVVCLGMMVGGCTKEKSKVEPTVEQNSQTNEKGTVIIDFHATHNGQPFEWGDTLALTGNRRYVADMLHYYISHLQLVDKAGKQTPLEDVLLIKLSPDGEDKHGGQSYTFRDVPAGEYVGLRFDVGLDSAQNHGDPTFYTHIHPLSAFNGMFWNWKFGYTFWKLEGSADTTAAGGQLADGPLSFHVGNSSLRRSVAVNSAPNSSFRVTNPLNPARLTLNCDLAAVFGAPDAPLNFHKSNFTHSTGKEFPLAEQLANRLPKAFQLEAAR